MSAADEDSPGRALAPREGDALSQAPDEPPVVARMVIEIRSDGSRTIARGALEDTTLGERVTLEASGTTPLALAAKLTRSLLTAPLLARQLTRGAAGRTFRALLGRSKDDDEA